MTDETPPQPGPSEPAPLPGPAEPVRKPFWKLESLNEVGRGRVVRLGLLIVVLFVLVGVAVFRWVSAKREAERKEQERLAQVTAAMETIRKTVGLLTPSLSGAELRRLFQSGDEQIAMVKELDPANVDVERLAVPLCYAAGHMDAAIDVFNGLNASDIAKELDPAVFRVSRALKALKLLTAESGSPLMTSGDRQYIRACGLLWVLGREITLGAPDDAGKALRLCRWMALHVLSDPPGASPGDPYIVVWRGHAGPVEAAWTYAELARQAGLRAQVVVPPAAEGAGTGESFLVQVYPAGGKPLLVAPYAGVPVMDPGSGDLLDYQEVLDAPERLAALRSLPGGDIVPTADRLRGAEMRDAVAVESCFPRMLVFDHLLKPLPQRPEVSLGALAAGGTEVRLWDQPLAIRNKITALDPSQVAGPDSPYIELVQTSRGRQLRGVHEDAAKGYSAQMEELARQAAAAETEESVATLRSALEFVAFAAPSNALDNGQYAVAETLAKSYLDKYPDGRWRPLTLLILAEALSAQGKEAEAQPLWEQPSGPRRLYGTLRARGLVTGSPALVVPAPAPAAAPVPAAAPATADAPAAVGGDKPGAP